MPNTALLALDTQTGIVAHLDNPNINEDLQRLSTTINKARSAGIKIVYVTTPFRPGYADLHDNFPSSGMIMASNKFVDGDETVQIHPADLPPGVKSMGESTDAIVTKRRVSAFAGTDLNLVLRCMGCDEIFFCGLVSSDAVLSTVRHGADLDYRLGVLGDGCMDRDPEVHDVLMDKVFSKKARVVDSEEWLAEL